MIDVRVRPLDLATWPGATTPPAKRRSPQFRSTWSDTLALLDAELRHLSAKDVVIEAGFRDRDLRLDGWPRADAKDPEFPGVVVSFGSAVGDLRYATDTFERGSYWVGSRGQKGEPGYEPGRTVYVPAWQANARAIALGLEALRAVDRYGITKRGEQYQGWAALPPAALALERGMTVEEAATLLEIPSLPDTSPTAVSDAYRAQAMKYHPDTGATPDLDRFHRVTKARDFLLDYLR